LGLLIIVAAGWMGVGAPYRRFPFQEFSVAVRLRAEHEALLTAARVRLRTAQQAAVEANWLGRWSANRAVRAAEEELQRVEASAPQPDGHRGILD
jgi:membrane protein